ncbi:MAG: glycosyltransferase family 2 protein [Candidatus Eremiobacteraeota bacterium]|nr:glycosyltransferase family 2 protein [Candidatus Eremiobacteraeota bacterium]
MIARIVVVNYNGAAFVAEALESALAQSAACEVVMVDNASTDGSPETIEGGFPRVRVLRAGSNRGFGAAATLGALAEPRDYDYVAFLNPDATAQPGWIETLCAWMDRERIDIGSSVVAGAAAPFFAGGRWQPFLSSAYEVRAFADERTDWISGCAMVVRREAFDRLGGFDPSYFLYYEDVDLSLRASALGMRLGVYSEALVSHPVEGRITDRLGRREKHRIGFASKGRLAGKHVPAFALPSALLFQCLVSPAYNGVPLRDYATIAGAFLEGFRSARRHTS